MSDTEDRTADLDRLRTLFRFFARTQCQGRSPLYTVLSAGIVEDEVLLRLLLDTPAEQRRPSLLLAAVNHLLRQRPDHPLAAYYPIHGGDRPADDQALAVFRAFCVEHATELRELLAGQHTQTNEIRRCFALRLGMHRIAQQWPGPVALLEIGASAGLNLNFDAYAYRIGDHTAEPKDGSPVLLTTTACGGGAVDGLLGEPSAVEYRLGADLRPVDLAGDPAARDWLAAFIWPEQVSELAVLRAATDLAVRERVPVVRADAVIDTARLIGEVPGDLPVVVFTASLLSYLDASARVRFVAQLTAAARTRRVVWLFTEAPGLLARAGVTAPAVIGPLREVGAVYAVGLSTRAVDGSAQDEVLALADPYVEWIAPARGAADDFSWAAGAGLYEPLNGAR